MFAFLSSSSATNRIVGRRLRIVEDQASWRVAGRKRCAMSRIAVRVKQRQRLGLNLEERLSPRSYVLTKSPSASCTAWL